MPVRFGKVTGAIFSPAKHLRFMIWDMKQGTAFKGIFTNTAHDFV
jgi:hypothetical protein